MFCYKCGAPINDGELFCSACGARQPGGQGEPPMQQPYGAQPVYGQPYGQPYGAQPPKKKSKKLLWISIAAVLVLAVAAAAVFVVLPAMGSGGGGLLSGNTVQTKFINDSVKVFTGAFSDLGSDSFKRMLSEPFDLSVDLTSDVLGQQFTGTVKAAYDKQTLGFSAESNGIVSKLLLLGDTFYADTNGSVAGLKFKTDADLSQPMSLSDRAKAIFQSLSENMGTTAKLDYKKLAELLVNSISADCFESSASRATLTLKPDDIIATMKTFTDGLDKDKALKEQLEDYIKEVSGTTVDVVEALSAAAQAMEATKDSVDFEIVWTLGYENGTPASLELAMNMSEDSFKFDFGYEKQDGGKDVKFALSTQDGSADVTGDISYKKTGGGIEYSGSISAMGETLNLNGSEERAGEKTHGEVTLSVPGSGDIGITYDESLTFGMPQGSVKDDGRFSIDTSNADVEEISSFLDYFMLAGGAGPVALDPGTPFEPAVTEEPITVDEPAETYQFTLIVPSTDNAYYQELVSAMETEFGYYGGELTVMTSNYDSQLEMAQAETTLAAGVDGIVIASVSDNDTISSFQSSASAAGAPVVFISDVDVDVNAIARDYAALCTTLAGYCTGNVYIVNGTADDPFSTNLESLLTSGLESNPDITVLGVGYTGYNNEAAKALTDTALTDYSDINTVVCLDPVSPQGVLERLNANGFAGSLICFTEEDTMDKMTSEATGSTYVTYAYFPVSDAAYAAAGRIFEIMYGDNAPKVKYLTPYTY